MWHAVGFEWSIIPGTLNTTMEKIALKMTKAVPLTIKQVKFKTSWTDFHLCQHFGSNPKKESELTAKSTQQGREIRWSEDLQSRPTFCKCSISLVENNISCSGILRFESKINNSHHVFKAKKKLCRRTHRLVSACMYRYLEIIPVKSC